MLVFKKPAGRTEYTPSIETANLVKRMLTTELVFKCTDLIAKCQWSWSSGSSNLFQPCAKWSHGGCKADYANPCRIGTACFWEAGCMLGWPQLTACNYFLFAKHFLAVNHYKCNQVWCCNDSEPWETEPGWLMCEEEQTRLHAAQWGFSKSIMFIMKVHIWGCWYCIIHSTA